ncbi:unnamed protein product [Nippostrongylus brasiliensis]|uniref:Uncharacterized protein n=1 Tax=Nippostrongylus brasiliensis TaxID=27835 RepID=A0A0N4XN34_NIPBR|nr:unnamed protein product [Nippostrongylus brasiliensis]
MIFLLQKFERKLCNKPWRSTRKATRFAQVLCSRSSAPLRPARGKVKDPIRLPMMMTV